MDPRLAGVVAKSASQGDKSALLFTYSNTLGVVADPDHPSQEVTKPKWTFLTNYGHVMVCIANDPGIRGRDIATQVGITERAAQAIIADLVDAGYIQRTRVGRRNYYRINPNQPLRHPVEHAHRIGDLLTLLGKAPSSEANINQVS